MSTLLTLALSALSGRRRKIRRLLGERVLRITLKPFMDMSTMPRSGWSVTGEPGEPGC